VKWIPVELRPTDEGPYLVYMPDRSLDRYSVQHYDRRDGWTNNYGITHWSPVEPPQGKP
jgi:hypothetical protein